MEFETSLDTIRDRSRKVIFQLFHYRREVPIHA
jgi:hypothetical protein